eukprot:scpid67460/ scgid14212/ 
MPCMHAFVRNQRNPLLDRIEFYKHHWGKGESFDSFYTSLRELYNACNFETYALCQTCRLACCGTSKRPKGQQSLLDLFGPAAKKPCNEPSSRSPVSVVAEVEEEVAVASPEEAGSAGAELPTPKRPRGSVHDVERPRRTASSLLSSRQSRGEGEASG